MERFWEEADAPVRRPPISLPPQAPTPLGQANPSPDGCSMSILPPLPERFSRREFLAATAAAGLGYLGTRLSEKPGATAAPAESALDPELDLRDSDYAHAVEQVKHSVFRISGPRGHGSGFLLHNGMI